MAEEQSEQVGVAEEEDVGDERHNVPMLRSSRRRRRRSPPLLIEVSEEENGEERQPRLSFSLNSDKNDEEESVTGQELERREKSTTNANESDGFSCPICMEPWCSSGIHRICSLPCGHLYGKSCIQRWIRQNGKNGKCPQCNKKCKMKDIRVLFASQIVVADGELQKEVLALRAENEVLKMQKVSLLEEIDRYKKTAGRELSVKNCERLDSWVQKAVAESQRSLVSHRPTIARTNHSTDRFVLKNELGLDGARVFDIDASNNLLLLSRKHSGLGNPHVLTKISLFSPREQENIHLSSSHKAIKDLQISCDHRNLALLASLGKKLSVFSMETNNVVLTYELQVPAWSCTWDSSSVHNAYVGLQNGTLLVFDLRQTARPMKTISGLTCHPIHTLQPLVDDGVPKLLAASSVGPCLINIGENEQRPCLIPGLENLGVCISLAYCAPTNEIVASFRPKYQISHFGLDSQLSVSPSPPSGMETLGSHVLIRNIDGIYQNCASAQSHVSGIQMPKTAIICKENNNTLFAHGDELTKRVCVRDLPSFQPAHNLHLHHQPILGVKYAHYSSHGLLCCMSENILQVYLYSED